MLHLRFFKLTLNTIRNITKSKTIFHKIIVYHLKRLGKDNFIIFRLLNLICILAVGHHFFQFCYCIEMANVKLIELL